VAIGDDDGSPDTTPAFEPSGYFYALNRLPAAPA
jgi:hypothetical protein